jgi:hypothetical protein
MNCMRQIDRLETAWRILGVTVSFGLVLFSVSQAGALDHVTTQIRLMAVSTGFIGAEPAVYEINPTDASKAFVMQVTDTSDSDALGWNAVEGVLYHTTGGESWSNEPIPSEGAYRDGQYMETLDLENAVVDQVVFNANGPPQDDPLIEVFGLPGLIPEWTYPYGLPPEEGGGQRRTLAQNTDEYRTGAKGRGPNEYHAVRHFAWHRGERQWYFSDELGLFTMTPSGTPDAPDAFPTKIGEPSFGGLKGLTFYHPGPGETRLLVGIKDEPSIYELDPATGHAIGGRLGIVYTDANGTVTGAPHGLVGLAQHPVTGELYGLSQGGGTFGRDLLRINATTGVAEIIGNVDIPGEKSMVALAFIGWVQGDLDRDGDADFDDIDDFVLALNDPTGYEALRGQPARVTGDQTEDWDVDFDDIAGFVELLSAGQGFSRSAMVPEPGAVSLAIAGSLVLWADALCRRRRRSRAASATRIRSRRA